MGKSTSTNALVGAMRRAGKRVGVLAVDPSSPFSGGALLGDRVRMGDHALDPDVYIRSMGARGHLGGLAWSTPQAVRVLDAAGCDVVVVETVGVGQSEVEVAGLADTTLVLLAPGMGDGIQAAKAGILEIGDVYVVNKADREGADRTRRELRTMLSMAERRDGAWRPPVLQTVASTGEGIDELLAEVDRHSAWLEESGELARRRTAGPGARSRRSPWRRCASAGAATPRAPTSTRSPAGWRPATSTPTPPPTSCSTAEGDGATPRWPTPVLERISRRSSAALRVQACSSGGLTASALTSSRWSPCSGLGTFATTAQWSPAVTSAVTTPVASSAGCVGSCRPVGVEEPAGLLRCAELLAAGEPERGDRGSVGGAQHRRGRPADGLEHLDHRRPQLGHPAGRAR